jgi:hypothetical protein
MSHFKFKELDRQADELEAQIKAWHRASEVSCNLENVPGIGPITASGLVATISDTKNFDGCVTAGQSVDDEDLRPRPGLDHVGLGAIRDLETHSRLENEPSSIGQFGFQLAFDAQQDMTSLTPVVRHVARAVFHHPHAHVPEVAGSPGRYSRFALVFCGRNGGPVGGSKRDVFNLHLMSALKATRIRKLECLKPRADRSGSCRPC